jgi:hypothetical protein
MSSPRAALRSGPNHSPDIKYTVIHVPHTWAELDALALRVEEARDQWRAQGIHLLAADPDAAASKAIVTLRGYRTAAASALTAAYGRDWISVVPSSARWIPLGDGRAGPDA